MNSAAPRRYQPGFSNPATLPAFQGIAALMSQGSKRSRLRRLAIVCAKGHTLAEVFGAGDQAVLLVGEKEAALLRELPAQADKPFFPGGTLDDLAVSVWCHCRRPTGVQVSWIKDELAKGTKRARIDPSVPRLRF